MPLVDAGEISMYYEVLGEGEPLILIGSMGTDLSGWRLQSPEFSKKYRVVTFDNRGWGQSDAPDVPYSIAMMADDTAGLMAALGIEQAHVLGKSMGGQIAQELAIRHPDRVRSLILASTSAGPYVLETPLLKEWAASALTGVSRKTLFQIMLPFVFTDHTFEDPEMAEMAIQMLAWGTSGDKAAPGCAEPYAIRRQFVACVEHYVRGRLGRVKAPTLVIAGRDEFFIPLELCQELAASIPGARLDILEGGGHALNEDIPEKFNRTVLDFLAEVA